MEVRRARLILSGAPLPRISFRLQGDFVKAPYLMDASVGVKVIQPLAVTIGQTKIPFSAESLVSDDRNAPVARSRAVLALSPGRDTGVQGRDVGALASGVIGRNGRRIEYAAGVFRGQTLIYAPRVHYRAVAGRLIVHPFSGWYMGADWYSGTAQAGGNTKRRADIEGGYERGRGTARFEQIFARDNALKRRGGYITGVWRVRKELEAVGRADWYTANVSKPMSTSIAYVAGANVFLFKHLKVGFNAGAQHDQGPQGWSSVVLAQVMPFF